MFTSSQIFRFISLIVALNYFAFRVELCEEEYEENHPSTIPIGVGFSKYSVNWETFDKDNAPKAFTIKVEPTIEIFLLNQPILTLQILNKPSLYIIRDKSPPLV